jgi:hypothetical protein
MAVYDGSGVPSQELKKEFPLCRVDAHISRTEDGTGFYDVRSGQNAFFIEPGGKAFFAGEEPKITLPEVAVTAKTEEWKPAPPVSIPVQPLNDAAKKNEGWKPTLPKRD